MFQLEIYRDPYLAEAMVSLNMIDTQGVGIKRIFQAQRRRFFPLPDYDLSQPARMTHCPYSFMETLPVIRNTYAHGSAMVHSPVLGIFEIVTDLVNQLYPTAIPALAA